MTGLLVIFNMLGNTMEQMQARIEQLEREVESQRNIIATLQKPPEPAE